LLLLGDFYISNKTLIFLSEGEELGRKSNASIFSGTHLESLDKLSNIVASGSHFPKQKNGEMSRGNSTLAAKW